MFGVPGAILELAIGFVLKPLKTMQLTHDLFTMYLLILNSNLNMFVTIIINMFICFQFK